MPTLKQITYNCRQATYLIEKKQFGRLSIMERFQLKYHLTGCSVCRIYQQQSIYISQVLQNNYAAFALAQSTLGEDFKADMQHRIDQVLNSQSG